MTGQYETPVEIMCVHIPSVRPHTHTSSTPDMDTTGPPTLRDDTQELVMNICTTGCDTLIGQHNVA